MNRLPLCTNCEEKCKTLYLKTMFEVRHGYEPVVLLCTYFFKLQFRCLLLYNVEVYLIVIFQLVILFEMCMVVPTYNLLRCRYTFDDKISDKTLRNPPNRHCYIFQRSDAQSV